MMADGPPPPHDVFISYAGPDRNIADTLGASLETAEVGVWWDARLEAGEPFERQIQRALAEARIVVAVLSPRTLTSEWVRWELSQASRNGLHIVPLLVDGARPEDLPPPLDLLPTLSAGPGADAAGALVQQIRNCLVKMARSPNRPRENDARRRLASAAAATARQAADIKQRKGRASALPPILVGIGDSGAATPTLNRFATSDGFAAFLRDQRISLAFTSSDTDELYLVGHAPTGQLVIDVQSFRKPTGLFAAGGSLLVGTLAHVFRLENILRPGQTLDGRYSHCYVPRIGYFTGVVDTHDVAQTDAGKALFVATRYNCLATASPVHSFRPIWRPPFVTGIVAEDRCHLNGVALSDGISAYATAISTTDSYDGWRDHLEAGGVVIDMRSDEVVCAGLTQPHSPREHDGRLWLLNSGRGEVGYLEWAGRSGGAFRPVARLPGFTRGLAFHGRHAVIGLSKPRYHDPAVAGLPDGLRDPEAAWCGFQVIDTRSGDCVHWFRIDGAVREIYDVAVLQGVACPRSVSPINDDGFDLITVDPS
jgi:uncharacterized protein (TIGR03032 family)